MRPLTKRSTVPSLQQPTMKSWAQVASGKNVKKPPDPASMKKPRTHVHKSAKIDKEIAEIEAMTMVLKRVDPTATPGSIIHELTQQAPTILDMADGDAPLTGKKFLQQVVRDELDFRRFYVTFLNEDFKKSFQSKGFTIGKTKIPPQSSDFRGYIQSPPYYLTREALCEMLGVFGTIVRAGFDNVDTVRTGGFHFDLDVKKGARVPDVIKFGEEEVRIVNKAARKQCSWCSNYGHLYRDCRKRIEHKQFKQNARANIQLDEQQEQDHQERIADALLASNDQQGAMGTSQMIPPTQINDQQKRKQQVIPENEKNANTAALPFASESAKKQHVEVVPSTPMSPDNTPLPQETPAAKDWDARTTKDQEEAEQEGDDSDNEDEMDEFANSYDYETEFVSNEGFVHEPSDDETEKPMETKRYKYYLEVVKFYEKDIVKELPEPKNADEKKQRDAQLSQLLSEKLQKNSHPNTYRRFVNEYKFRTDKPQKEELLNFTHEQERMTKQARAEWIHKHHPTKPWEKLKPSELKEAEKFVSQRIEQLLVNSFPRRYEALMNYVRNKNGAEW